jgi:hypothetical protein
MSVPMIKSNNLTTVKTSAAVTIAPFSQALFQVSPTSPVKPGDYMIEGQLQAPTGNPWIGRTPVNPAMAKMYCCALNITHKPLKFRAGTPMGVLAPVQVMKEFKPEPPPNVTTLPSMQEMREAIEKKGITLEGTVTKDEVLNKFITLLHRISDICCSMFERSCWDGHNSI